VVEFLRTIPRKDRIANIGKKIAREEAGLLLAWAVEGAQRVLEQGHYSELLSSKLALAEWTRTANPVSAWIADRVLPALADVEEPPRVSSADAFADFRAWHLVNEGQTPRIKQARFTQDLQRAGLDGVRYIPGSNGFRGFEGLRLGKQTDAMNAATRRAVWDGAFAAQLAASTR
jgi:phage/plasmid-associated DNA primase